MPYKPVEVARHISICGSDVENERSRIVNKLLEYRDNKDIERVSDTKEVDHIINNFSKVLHTLQWDNDSPPDNVWCENVATLNALGRNISSLVEDQARLGSTVESYWTLYEEKENLSKNNTELTTKVSSLTKEKSQCETQQQELTQEKSNLESQISKLTEQSKTLCNELDETQLAMDETHHDCINLI
ncbi:hypothetical protein [Candidatus Mesenet endosymbiont of Phosphuga atrata]|uniref:hypothetical protein n=1 Tax=Candidatus Mesenet endosymbiont of Phosphuga atrata TaxID=3066221 RepID=UPI0030D5381F